MPMLNQLPELQTYLRDRLEFPRAVLVQLRDTCLCNSMVDEAIEDIDAILNLTPENLQCFFERKYDL